MGYLSVDHRGGQGIDEKDGKLVEFDTINCGHCTTLIAVLNRPTEKVFLTNMDIAAGANVAQHLKHEYTAKFTCRKCRKGVCRACAEAAANGGECNPITKAVERYFNQRDRQR